MVPKQLKNCQCLNIVFSIIYKNDDCQAKQGAQAAMDLILEDKVHAIIGSVCSQGWTMITLLFYNFTQVR